MKKYVSSLTSVFSFILSLNVFAAGATTSYTLIQQTDGGVVINKAGPLATNGLQDMTKYLEIHYAEPSYYAATVYEVRVCSSFPTLPTTTSTYDFSNCPLVLSAPSGTLVEISDGVSQPIIGDVTRPANGTYTHYVFISSNIFKFKGSVNFGDTHPTPVAATPSYVTGSTVNSATSSNETANQCAWTSAGVGHSESRVTGTKGACASAGTPGLTQSEKISFKGKSACVLSKGSSGSWSAMILDSRKYLASVCEADADNVGDDGNGEPHYMAIVKPFSSPVAFTDDTRGIDFQTTVKKAMLVQSNPKYLYNVTSGSPSTTSNKRFVKFDSGPWDLSVTVR